MTDGPMTIDAAIRVRLEQTRGEVPVSDLFAHLDRDAVFIVAGTQSLVECGVAIAMDDVERVRALIEASDLRKPSLSERDHWRATPTERLVSVVVQPFVLVQALPD